MSTLVSLGLPAEFILLFEQADLFDALTQREQEIAIAYTASAYFAFDDDDYMPAGLLSLVVFIGLDRIIAASPSN